MLTLFCDNRHMPVQANPLYSLCQKGPRGIGIAPGSQSEINQLSVRVNCPPQIPPFSADADVCLVHVPIQAGALQVRFRTFSDLRAKLLHPPETQLSDPSPRRVLRANQQHSGTKVDISSTNELRTGLSHAGNGDV